MGDISNDLSENVGADEKLFMEMNAKDSFRQNGYRSKIILASDFDDEEDVDDEFDEEEDEDLFDEDELEEEGYEEDFDFEEEEEEEDDVEDLGKYN